MHGGLVANIQQILGKPWQKPNVPLSCFHPVVIQKNSILNKLYGFKWDSSNKNESSVIIPSWRFKPVWIYSAFFPCYNLGPMTTNVISHQLHQTSCAIFESVWSLGFYVVLRVLALVLVDLFLCDITFMTIKHILSPSLITMTFGCLLWNW